MRSRADEFRKRMLKRKREREKMLKKAGKEYLLVSDEEKYGFERIPAFEEEPGEGGYSLFRKDFFLFKILASACLVLIVAIVIQNEGKYAEPVRTAITKALEQDFHFASVSDWYEKHFGKPLALLPFKNDKTGSGKDDEPEYAVPATGRILKDFDRDGQSITIETEKGETVSAMKEGIVRFIGEKEGFGKTVIIQHSDQSESWYGNLQTIDAELYQFIEKGARVGTASDTPDGKKGSFNFAIKKGDDFIDPIQVIQFE